MTNFIVFNLQQWPVVVMDLIRAPADDQEWLQYEADILELYSARSKFSIVLNIHTAVPWRYIMMQGLFMKAHLDLSKEYLTRISVFVKTLAANALLSAFLVIHQPSMPIDVDYFPEE